jgi:hypothetical protein
MTKQRSFPLLIVGYILAFYAGFCLLGGPDGTILSRDSFIFGVPSLVISGLLVFMSDKSDLLGGYVFSPLLAVIIAWLVAVASFQMAGFYILIFGTIASAVAVVGKLD